MHLRPVWIQIIPDLARRKHCRPHHCGPPRKRPAGCLQDPLGPPGTPGLTRYSTAGRQHAPPAARRPETGAVASSLSGRSGDACTTCQLEAHRDRSTDRRHENLLIRHSLWRQRSKLLVNAGSSPVSILSIWHFMWQQTGLAVGNR